jgi:indolepyruvate ferredoxin oxidoreductase beta subunit
MDLQVVIAGLGGEGIIFLTRLFAEGVYRCGHPVISTETHGMAMRGGSVISQIKIGDYNSPMIRRGEADILVGTSDDEAERYLPYLKEGGVAIKNTPLPETHGIDASRIANEVGNPQGVNVVLLGYVLAHLAPAISLEPFLEVTEELTPERFCARNLKALEAGWRIGLRDKGGNKAEGGEGKGKRKGD